jgi:hypothetical protein
MKVRRSLACVVTRSIPGVRQSARGSSNVKLRDCFEIALSEGGVLRDAGEYSVH